MPNYTRYVFFAGVGGTGHHMFRELMLDWCSFSAATDEALRRLWYDRSDFDEGYTQLVRSLKQAQGLVCLNLLRADSMLSYPDRNNKLYHPDVISLAAAAEEAKVDLRLVVLHRDPRAMVISTSIHRGFLGLYAEAQQSYNQLGILYSQLRAVDSYRCAPYSAEIDLADIFSFIGRDSPDLNASYAKLDFKPFDGPALERTIRSHANGDDLRVKFLGLDRIYYSRFLPDICGAEPRLHAVEKRTTTGRQVIYATDATITRALPCTWDAKANEELWQLWYGLRDFDAAFDALVARLRSHNDTLCLRPEGNSTHKYIDLYHEDLVSLAAAAEAAEADLRVVVVHSDPRTAVAREGGDAFTQVQIMYNRLCFLYAQLRVIDTAFYHCVARNAGKETNIDALATFLGFYESPGELRPKIRLDDDVPPLETADKMKAKFLAFDRIYYDSFLPDVCS